MFRKIRNWIGWSNSEEDSDYEEDATAEDSNRLWHDWFGSGKRICKPIDPPLRLDEPIYEDKVRFVCISDTHDTLHRLQVPYGDVLVHCGDFTNLGDRHEIEAFNDAIGKLPHRHKIVIGGNHDLGFDETEDLSLRRFLCRGHGTPNGQKLLTNCTIIQDQMIEILGIKIYGTSWHPMSGWSYYRPRGTSILEKWNLIPNDIDVLLTHTPPLGHGDYRYNRRHEGDADLLETIETRAKPKFHVFGHIHKGHGVTTNNETVFINASICSIMGKIAHPPVLFDLPLRPGITKDM